MPEKPETLRQFERRISGKMPESHRESAYRRGYTKNWQKIRRMHLAKHPLCVECEVKDIIEPATDVHHIDGNNRNNVEENLQSLCHQCHSRRTRKDEGGRRKDESREPRAARG
jgi:5-methylcytosine-specific restriction protein A